MMTAGFLTNSTTPDNKFDKLNPKTLIMNKLLILLCLIAGSAASAQVTVSWVNYPAAVAVATDASDNVYTAYWDYNPAGDITVTKRDANGNILWEVPYNNTNSTRHEVATWVETDSQGNVIVSGTIRSGYSNPVNANSLLMKFSPAGNLLWRVVYETDFDGSSTRKCLIDAQDNIYVLGLGNSGTGMVTKVKKFSPDGAALWSYFDTGGGAPLNFKFTPDNHIVISKRGITGSINAYTKINLNGGLIWNTAGINSLTTGDVAGDSFGNSYLINGNYSTGVGSVLRKLSPDGTTLWESTSTIAALRVEAGSDNNPVISGFPNSGSFGAAFVKYDSNGNQLWQNLDADGPGYNLLSHTQMRLDASNAAYLTASIMTAMAVCKVNSEGTSAWTATLSGGYAYALDFGTDNSVYVAGGTTAKLSQSGGGVTLPAAPSGLTATATGTTSIGLSWTDNSTNETSFILQRSLASGSGYTSVATLPANTVSYSNTGLNSSTTYFYRIQAVNSSGSSGWSNVANATTNTPVTLPAAPSNLTAAAAGCNSISLNWTDNSNNENSFEIVRSMTVNGVYTPIATVPANIRTYTNTGLTRGKRYYYKVRAINTAGSSAWSNKANAMAKCPSANTMITGSEEIRLYPNPVAQGALHLDLPLETELPVTMQVYSMSGMRVLNQELNNHANEISTESLVNGVYIVLISGNDTVQKFKIMVNK